MKSCTAEIVISAKSRRIASSIRDALSPDLSILPGNGQSAKLSLKGSNIILKFESSDLASLRAGLNSALLLASASFRCITV
ncbi:MAG TPA: KEOPS complex subunit Pcc1 [Nitrososphaera sp.]|nr:KEOPS complex subunit Pcc1 [Nitrososphaera sp.]